MMTKSKYYYVVIYTLVPIIVWTYICVYWLFSLDYDIKLDNNSYHPKFNTYQDASIVLVVIFTKLLF